MYLRLKKLKNPMKKKKLFWNKKSQLVFAESVMITCGCMLLGVPLIGSGFGSGDSYYEVTLAGKTVGSVKRVNTSLVNELLNLFRLCIRRILSSSSGRRESIRSLHRPAGPLV